MTPPPRIRPTPDTIRSLGDELYAALIKLQPHLTERECEALLQELSRILMITDHYLGRLDAFVAARRAKAQVHEWPRDAEPLAVGEGSAHTYQRELLLLYQTFRALPPGEADSVAGRLAQAFAETSQRLASELLASRCSGEDGAR